MFIVPFSFWYVFATGGGLWKLLFLCPFVTHFGSFSLTWFKLGSFLFVPFPPLLLGALFIGSC